jgi:hypothetical protein
MTEAALIDSIDFEIEKLIKENPLRSWNNFFSAISKKLLSEYEKVGRYRLMLSAQYSDAKLFSILNPLRENYSFIDYDFNDAAGNLILKNKATGEFEELFIGDQAIELLFEVCDKFESVEKKKLHQGIRKDPRGRKRKE